MRPPRARRRQPGVRFLPAKRIGRPKGRGVMRKPPIKPRLTRYALNNVRKVIEFWEWYEYRPLCGPVNDTTREEAVREYLKARNALGSDFVELGRHCSVGANYRSTWVRQDDPYEPGMVRYDVVLELYIHVPRADADCKDRLLRKGVMGELRPDRYDMVYAGTVSYLDVDLTKGTCTVFAGTGEDFVEMRFSLDPPLRE